MQRERSTVLLLEVVPSNSDVQMWIDIYGVCDPCNKIIFYIKKGTRGVVSGFVFGFSSWHALFEHARHLMWRYCDGGDDDQ